MLVIVVKSLVVVGWFQRNYGQHGEGLFGILFLKACCVVHVNVSCTTVTLDWSLCSLNLVFGESILSLPYGLG